MARCRKFLCISCAHSAPQMTRYQRQPRTFAECYELSAASPSSAKLKVQRGSSSLTCTAGDSCRLAWHVTLCFTIYLQIIPTTTATAARHGVLMVNGHLWASAAVRFISQLS